MSFVSGRWDLEVDFVAVGSGIGGITAAIAAHDAGLEALVLEKGSRLGGVSAWSGGEVFVPCNHKLEPLGIVDSPEAARAYLTFLSGGYGDDVLRDRLLQKGIHVTRYLEEKAGIPWKVVERFPDYHYPRAPGTVSQGRYLETTLFAGAELGDWQAKTWSISPHMPPGITHEELFGWGSLSCVLQWDFRLMGRRVREDVRGMGPGMMAWFIKAAVVDRRIPARVSTPVHGLLVEDGRVIGVRAAYQGAELRIRARRGVLLATGGYDWHPEFPRYYEGLPEWRSVVQPTVSGDNLLLGAELGATVAGVPPHNLGMFFGYHVPGEEQEGGRLNRASWEGGYPHAIWVNRAGRRFCDESFYRDYLPRVHSWDGIAQQHPNYPPFLIFDQSYRDRYPFATFFPGQEVPEAMLARADTPRSLAEKLGIDGDGLEATIARFNQFAGEGVDPDFNRGTWPWAAMMTGDRARKNPNLGPLDRPPFYGIRLEPASVGINAFGLKTDHFARVVHVRGHPIDGLYAAGNAAAPLDTGAGYQSGLSNLRGMVWGFLAARHAAGFGD